MSLFILLSYYFSWFCWRDFLEIGMLSFIFYFFINWISKSLTPSLLLWVYGSLSFYWVCNILDLSLITNLFWINLPVMLVLLVIFHQDVLQRSFVTPKRIIPSIASKDDDWLEVLMRGLLQLAHQQGIAKCIIERNENLETILYSVLPFQTKLTDAMLTKALTLHTADSCIWVKESGYLTAVDAVFLKNSAAYHDRKELFQWQQQALLLTTKTDAIFLYIHGVDKKINLVVGGNFLENISFCAGLKVLRQYLENPLLLERKYEKNYKSAA